MGVLQRLATIAADYAYAVRRQLRGVVLRPDPTAYDSGAPGRATVLLLPGVYEQWWFLQPIAQGLHRLGHRVLVLPELGRNVDTIPASADLVLEQLRRRDAHGVVIVAHSKGGLIGKLAMLNDTEGRIARMVAVASPFSGSAYARYFRAQALRAFLPSDSTIVMLGEQLEVNSRITAIRGPYDPHIPHASDLIGADNVVLPESGHFRVLSSPEVRRRVLDALREV
jgi:triacylglycerol lipase